MLCALEIIVPASSDKMYESAGEIVNFNFLIDASLIESWKNTNA
jgi:hypothetical protein